MSNIGVRLKNSREKSNLSQIQVSKLTGINNKTLSNYENGVSYPDPDTITLLAKLYKVSADYLLGLDEEMNNDIQLDDFQFALYGEVKDLTEDEVASLRKEVDKYTVEGDLRRDVQMNIKNKMEINCYEGVRHKKGLPVRGQRTSRNAKTRKGKGKVVANKKKVGK